MDKELKPCPFCGCKEVEEERTGGDDLDYLSSVTICCTQCEAEITIFVGLKQTRSKEHGDKAIAEVYRQWNARAYEAEMQSLRAENERLLETLRQAKKLAGGSERDADIMDSQLCDIWYLCDKAIEL